MILQDDREHYKWKARLAEILPSVQVERLPVADYVIFDADGHTTGIERKAIRDLVSSISQNKLKRQVQALAQFDRGILLIEGQWGVDKEGALWVHNHRVGWAPQSIQAILLAIQEQTGAKVIHTTNYDETALFLRMLEHRAEKGCFWDEEHHAQAA
jgi:ERCC4-type nuclease